MKYIENCKEFYQNKIDEGLLCITFIKKNGDLRTMLCTSNELVLNFYGCISKASRKNNEKTLSVVDVIIDRPSFISFDRVLSIEYISYLDLIEQGEVYSYNLYEDMLKQFEGLDVNDIIISNL